MDFKSLYKAANDELETNKEKALEQIFKKAESAPAAKKHKFYRAPAVTAACAAVFILCFGAVNYFSDFTGGKNTTLDSTPSESILGTDKAEIKNHVYITEHSADSVSDEDKTENPVSESTEPSVKENKPAPANENPPDEKSEARQEPVKEEKAEIAEADIGEAEPESAEIFNVPSEAAAKNAESAAADDEDFSDFTGGDAIYAENAGSYPSLGSSAGGGSGGTAMSKAFSAPLTVNVICVSYSDGVLTLNDPIYGKITSNVNENTEIFTADGETVKAKDIKAGTALTVTYFSQPENGAANIKKIIIIND